MGAGIILLPHTYRYFRRIQPLDTKRSLHSALLVDICRPQRPGVVQRAPGSLISSWNHIPGPRCRTSERTATTLRKE